MFCYFDLFFIYEFVINHISSHFCKYFLSPGKNLGILITLECKEIFKKPTKKKRENVKFVLFVNGLRILDLISLPNKNFEV